MQSAVDMRLINAIQSFLGKTMINGAEAPLMMACQQLLQGISAGAYIIVVPEAPAIRPPPGGFAAASPPTNGDGSPPAG